MVEVILMKTKSANLGASKRKPSPLLVYLALENNGRLKPMNRGEIVSYIDQNFGVHIEPKTVTESAAVLKVLSEGEHPIINFKSKGKSGYLLGNATSPLSQEEVVRLLTCFSTISSEASHHVFEGLRPYMSEDDVRMVEKIQAKLPVSKKQPNKNSMDYFAKLRIILKAFDLQKEVVFDHRYLDAKGMAIQEEKDVALVPYNLFEKNGRFYLLGGRMGGINTSEGKRSCLYIADTENTHNVRVGQEEAKDLPMADCIHGKSFDINRYLSAIYFVREGIFHPTSEKGHLAEINNEAAYRLTKQMYGSCVEDVKNEVLTETKDRNAKVRVRYTVRLHLDWPALVMWSLYFAWAGKLILDPKNIENKFLMTCLAGHAGKAYQQYVEAYQPQKEKD
jgi:hypothetical protein